MTIFVNRSIPLSEESRNGWTRAGAIVLSRNDVRRRGQVARRQATDEDGTMVLVNLGLGANVDIAGDVYNLDDTVRSILTPAAIRRTMPDLLPSQASEVEHWHKGPGYHGENKVRHNHTNMPYGHRHDHQQNGWDVQQHVEGTEYRVITVGDTVVQAHKKSGTFPDFDWEWVGVGGIKNNGIIPLVKRAVALVPNGERSVFGWDVIVGVEGPVILEANSSPGVNDATARRIVEQIRRTNGT